jgi:hypothetical protein
MNSKKNKDLISWIPDFQANHLEITEYFLVSSEPLGLVFDPEAQTRRELVAERLNVEDGGLCGYYMHILAEMLCLVNSKMLSFFNKGNACCMGFYRLFMLREGFIIYEIQ